MLERVYQLFEVQVGAVKSVCLSVCLQSLLSFEREREGEREIDR